MAAAEAYYSGPMKVNTVGILVAVGTLVEAVHNLVVFGIPVEGGHNLVVFDIPVEGVHNSVVLGHSTVLEEGLED